jgi:hypothetical protein
MKHLRTYKLFESDHEGGLWEVITEEEWDRVYDSSQNFIPFEQREIDSIKKLLPDIKPITPLFLQRFGSAGSSKDLTKITWPGSSIEAKSSELEKYYKIHFIITKFDDEWFFVLSTYDDETYKCDTLQGLINLINWHIRWDNLRNVEYI